MSAMLKFGRGLRAHAVLQRTATGASPLRAASGRSLKRGGAGLETLRALSTDGPARVLSGPKALPAVKDTGAPVDKKRGNGAGAADEKEVSFRKSLGAALKDARTFDEITSLIEKFAGDGESQAEMKAFDSINCARALTALASATHVLPQNWNENKFIQLLMKQSIDLLDSSPRHVQRWIVFRMGQLSAAAGYRFDKNEIEALTAAGKRVALDSITSPDEIVTLVVATARLRGATFDKLGWWTAVEPALFQCLPRLTIVELGNVARCMSLMRVRPQNGFVVRLLGCASSMPPDSVSRHDSLALLNAAARFSRGRAYEHRLDRWLTDQLTHVLNSDNLGSRNFESILWVSAVLKLKNWDKALDLALEGAIRTNLPEIRPSYVGTLMWSFQQRQAPFPMSCVTVLDARLIEIADEVGMKTLFTILSTLNDKQRIVPITVLDALERAIYRLTVGACDEAIVILDRCAEDLSEMIQDTVEATGKR